MPAPRLLDKKQVSANLATERKQDIDKGIKIAKSIDALRETRGKEELELEEFRTNTLKVIQAQIVQKQSENAQLTDINRLLKEERIRLEAPIDLTQAWKEIQELQERHEIRSEELLSREVVVLTRENDTDEREESFKSRESELGRSEEAIEENLRTSEKERKEAEIGNLETQSLLSKVKVAKAEQEALILSQEEEFERKDLEYTLREEQIKKDELYIINQKILLADRRTLLEQGFEELKRKQNGTNR